MAIKISFDQKRNLGLFSLHGEISFEEIRDTLYEVSKHLDPSPVMSILWDLTNANIMKITAGQIRQIACLVGERWGNHPRSKAALIARGKFEFGMARMYEIYLANNILGEVEVFHTKEEALNWLGVNDEYSVRTDI